MASSACVIFSEARIFSASTDDQIKLTAGESTTISITLMHETELQQNIEVHSETTQIDPETTSHEESLVQREIIDVPVPSNRDIQQSLTSMPQVVTDSSGTLHVAGARQGQTEVLLDGFEVNDPGDRMRLTRA